MMIKLRLVLAGLLTGPADSWGVMAAGQAAGGQLAEQVSSVGARRWAREMLGRKRGSGRRSQ